MRAMPPKDPSEEEPDVCDPERRMSCKLFSNKDAENKTLMNGHGPVEPCRLQQLPKKGVHCSRVTIVTSVLCCLFILITVVTVTVVLTMHMSAQNISSSKETELCLPCNNLNISLTGSDTKYVVNSRSIRRIVLPDERGEICCGKKSLIESHFKKVTPKRTAPEIKAIGPPSDSVMVKYPVAHLTLARKQNTQPDEDTLYPVLGWKYEKSRFSIRQHCPYKDGRLEISITGLYYVYSQVHFLERPTDRMHEYPAQSLSHYMFKYNRYLANGGYRKLLQNSASRCHGKGSYLERSSYLGAVMNLEKGDQIFVKVNNLTSLHPNVRSTFFGLYYISSSE